MHEEPLNRNISKIRTLHSCIHFSRVLSSNICIQVHGACSNSMVRSSTNVINRINTVCLKCFIPKWEKPPFQKQKDAHFYKMVAGVKSKALQLVALSLLENQNHTYVEWYVEWQGCVCVLLVTRADLFTNAAALFLKTWCKLITECLQLVKEDFILFIFTYMSLSLLPMTALLEQDWF